MSLHLVQNGDNQFAGVSSPGQVSRAVLEMTERTDGTHAAFVVQDGKFFLHVTRTAVAPVDTRVELSEQQFKELTSATPAEGKGKEIEGKYLVVPPWEPAAHLSSYPIVQGYIIADNDAGNELRVRRKGDAYYMTFKGDGTLERVERETKLQAAQFEKLFPITAGRDIVKTRYEAVHSAIYGEQIIYIDVYGGRLRSGPRTAEAEFDGADRKEIFEGNRPLYLSSDVTADKRLKNKNLALHGWPKGTLIAQLGAARRYRELPPVNDWYASQPR